MSSSWNKSDMERSMSVQSNFLPPTFMQAFSIDKEYAKCIKCNFLCKNTACNTFFHLTVCNGSLVEEKIQKDFKLNCLMCNFSTKNIDVWINHLFHLQHISVLNPYLYVTRYSYDCDLCKTHYYGSEDEILKHQCKPKALSMLSKFMVYAYYHFDINNKRMLYYCAHCEHYSYTLTDLHVKKRCKAIKKQDFVCNMCLITFYGFCEDTFSNHKISFQHLALWCLNSDKSKPRTLASMNWKLPSYMSNFFVISKILKGVSCNVCNEVMELKYDCIYNHFIQCISSRDISENDKNTPLHSLICSVCDFQYSSPEEDLYKDWVQHVISLDHLKKTVEKRNRYKLYTYYCFVSETVYYGTESFMVQNILKKNSDIGRFLFVSEVMALVYKRSNTYSCKIKGKVLYICGFCESSTDDQSEYCEHANIDSNPIFNCSSCLVVFNVKSDYIEHLISSDHIILRYFKPNQRSEFKILEHSMNTLQMNISDLIKSDDDMNASLSDTSSLDELMFIPYSDSVETDCQDQTSETYYSPSSEYAENELCINNEQSQSQLIEQYTESYNPEIDVSNFIEKLSLQSKKSAFNNHLRMNFELLNQMPLVTNVFIELKSFYCIVCDLVHCDLLKWTQHIKEFHTQLDLSVSYCAVCQIYQTGTSISISKHVETVEHSVMVEFQEYMKNNKHSVFSNVINDNNAVKDNIIDSKDCKNNTKDSSNANKQKKNIKLGVVSKSQECTQNNEKRCLVNNNINRLNHEVSTTADVNPLATEKDESQINNNIYIEFKDVNDNLKRKKYRLLRKLLEDKYGGFEKISHTSESYIILFQTMKQVDRLIKDKKKLKIKHGFTFIVVFRNCNEKLKTNDFMNDWCMMCTQISNQLDQINGQKSLSKINELCESINSLSIKLGSFHVDLFGSHAFGLATEKSDVDLFLEIDGTSDCEISRAVSLVKKFARKMHFRHEEFKNVTICDTCALVPILKFYHTPTNFNCNISFSGGLALYNSGLINSYLSMDPTVKWLACVIVHNWAVKNNLIDKNMFSKHQLIWLVLFYLMEESVIPPLFELMKAAPTNDHKIVEGWDCIFGEWSVNIKIQNHPKLLLGFFQYCTNKIKFMNYVLCTFTGKCFKKDKFFKKFSKVPEINETQRTMFKTFQSNISSNFQNNNHGLAVQAPFNLSHNLTKNIHVDKLTKFCNVCDKTITLLINTKCLNTF